ncbi:MAG TPA: bifunctional phosphoribosylaminoimidazolecarboxamide formyltransferase/IMP cyclohydrolase [Candidatus Sulfotelmatobacter sp.]|nr:bifunctional phosphoribosylaminoimidazolecarboxamide formyltransferase/IMP cyclohydrolase [Candidatus Sulfotelmatobacter sp.]
MAPTAVAVGVSGTGSNLAALLQAQRRGALGGHVTLVFADRDCPALGIARAAGVPTLLLRPLDWPGQGAWDAALAAALREAQVGVVALAGFMRLLGPAVLAAFRGRILNVHPSLLPAFAGGHAIDDALAAGVTVTGVTVHLVDETLDGGPIVFQEAVAIRRDDDGASLAPRIHAVEHRLLPRAVALLAGGALTLGDDGRVAIDAAAAAEVPWPRRALLSVSDKAGLLELARELMTREVELVSTGGTARTLREAGLPVTDVADVTGFPEMLDGRVKTVHPRIHGGVLADRRQAGHRAELAAAVIAPFEFVVVNLYPFEAAAERPGITIDELIEEIDIGGPALVRAAAKNHASVAVLTSPDQYGAVIAELERDGAVGEATRRRLAVAAFRRTHAYDGHIASELSRRLGVVPDGAADGAADDLLPLHLVLDLERVQRLRYGENPHQVAALYRRPDAPAGSGPFATGVDLRQGKALSYNNLLDAAAAAGVARDLHGAAAVIVKHANPCGAAEGDDVLVAWDRALAGDPVSAYGGVAAVTRPVDGPLAERLTAIFLEVVVAPELTVDGATVLAGKPNLRVVVDPWLGRPPVPDVEIRSAGGGVLATTADTAADRPDGWSVVTSRAPTPAEARDLDLAWRLVRHVRSNAIVLVKDGALVGVGAGQMSRVDSARLAVEKAGPERAHGAVCASDAFFPFADGVEACLGGGVSAFVQPGGSVRDAEVVAAAERAGAAMVTTGVRHFRH